VLLLHGFPTWSYDYAEMASDLAADHDVITMDFPVSGSHVLKWAVKVLPRAAVTELPGVGHYPSSEAPLKLPAPFLQLGDELEWQRDEHRAADEVADGGDRDVGEQPVGAQTPRHRRVRRFGVKRRQQ
jgi:pimeloyl-ACP methyl ester carboxylesterase